MAVQTIKVCDVCRKAEDVHTYEVTFPDGRLSVDLCMDHCIPLQEVRDSVPRSNFVKHGQSRRRTKIVVDPSAI